MSFEPRRRRRVKPEAPTPGEEPAAPAADAAAEGNGAPEAHAGAPGDEPKGYPWNDEASASDEAPAPPPPRKKRAARKPRRKPVESVAPEPEQIAEEALVARAEPEPAPAEIEIVAPEPEQASEEIEVVRADLEQDSEEVRVETVGTPAAWVEPTRQRPRRIRAMGSIIGLALAAFVIGLLVFNNMVMPNLIHSVGEVRVPDLTNLTVEQAERALRSVNLVLSRAGERFDPSVPRGFILSQDPPAETPVRGKKRVLVVVSLGEEFSTVPELFGESQRSAGYLLERAGLKLGAITRAPSEEVGEGLVAGSDPPAEALLARDAPVSILVSSGAGPESYVMPDVGGREINGVRRQLESIGFRVFTPPAAPSIGTIVFQDPPPGSRITRGATIMLQATGRMIR